MRRLLRTALAVGVTMSGLNMATAQEQYDRSFSRDFSCPPCQTVRGPRSPVPVDLYDCADGYCFDSPRFGPADFVRFQPSNSPRLRGRIVPNYPPFRGPRNLQTVPSEWSPLGNQPPVPQFDQDQLRPALPRDVREEIIIPSKQKGIAKLPLIEQKLALKQRVCPVTEDLLGSMGKPIKLNVAGQSIYVCCQGCVDTLRENPAKYLAKLKQTRENNSR